MVFAGYIALAVAIIGIILGVMLYPGPPENNMTPNTLDSFQITQAVEGSVVPLVFGRRRLPGNILYYNDLTTVELTEDVGKGGGGDEMTTGYRYYMDLWQAICLGPGVTIVGTYEQDTPITQSDLGTYVINPGDSDYFPTEAGQYSAPLHGVCTIFLSQFYLGENVSMVPTLHFIVERLSTAPLTYANLDNGTNPAAIIYDLCVLAGAESGDFDVPSFQEAADYWYSLGYGLNMAFDRQAELRELIRNVLVYVEGAVRIDQDDKIVLKAFKPTDTKSAEMDTLDYKEFQFIRRTWDDVDTDFRANYIDEDQEFTKRTLRVRNSAVHKLIGYDRQRTIDLTAFRDKTAASKRLWEMMKRMSYPEAQIKCTVGPKYAEVNIGDIVEITNTDYGLAAAEFRVMRKDEGGIGSNDIKFAMVQMLDNLFDDNYVLAGDPIWATPDYQPKALVKQDVFELPYNSQTGESPAYLLLAAREGVETSFTSLVSIDGVDYLTKQRHSTFSQHGELAETYNAAETYWFDDEKGILYTPYKEDPEFLTVSRTTLFGSNRVAIIGNEMIAFQTVTPEGANNIRLAGCIRGLLNTPIENHAISDPIWLTNVGSAVLTGLIINDFKVKLIPYFGSTNVDPASATPIDVLGTNKAATPHKIGRVQVVRSGSTCTVTLWPTTKIFPGAGVIDLRYHTDKWPPDYNGGFEHYTNITPTTIVSETEATFDYTQASAHNFYVRHAVSGFTSDYVSVYVPSADGTYIGPVL